MDFYQIKTKENGNWTLTQILKIEKTQASKKVKSAEKKMSCLAKLYSNQIVCHGQEITASFVSNARFRLPLASGEDGALREEICFAELSAKDLGKIRLQLKAEHDLDDEPDCRHLSCSSV